MREGNAVETLREDPRVRDGPRGGLIGIEPRPGGRARSRGKDGDRVAVFVPRRMKVERFFLHAVRPGFSN